MPSSPLSNVVVADFTQILAGPFCTQMLADAGATVIKVEPPGGESSRIRGPQRVGRDGRTISSYSAVINRNKRSICLDLKNATGRSIALDLIDRADVVIENFSPGAFSRLGIKFDELRKSRPELITCSISLFGGYDNAGELASRGGLAIVAESESSMAWMQRDKDGTPIGFGSPLGDLSSGMAAYAAIVTALFAHGHTGIGQHIDVPMIRVLMSLNSIAIASEDIVSSNEAERRQMNTAAYGIFRTRDGYVAIGVNTDSLFARLARAMDKGWMAEDVRYTRYGERDQRVDEVNAEVTAWSSKLSAAEVIAVVSPLGVPCGLVATPRDVLDSDALAHLGFLETVDDGLGGEVTVPANPYGYRRESSRIPHPGEDSAEILAEIVGIVDTDYENLRAVGAFGSP